MSPRLTIPVPRKPRNCTTCTIEARSTHLVETIDVAIIGGGVSGLAIASAIASRGLSVCVLERHPRPGLETSTHNSGVVHGGMYYPTGSLKAQLCIEGRELLYRFAADYAVAYDRCGKLIIAADPDETK